MAKNKPSLTKKTLTEIIQQKSGNLTNVAKHFKVTRATIYKKIDLYGLRDVLDEEREKMIDTVESAFYDNCKRGNTAAQIFFLKTQGKNRGYVERKEITGVDGGALQVDAAITGALDKIFDEQE